MNDIKDKINAMISNLKEKLPSIKTAEDEPLEEEAIADSVEDQEDTPTETEMEEVPAPSDKKKRLIIQVVLGSLVLYLVYEQVFPPPRGAPPP